MGECGCGGCVVNGVQGIRGRWMREEGVIWSGGGGGALEGR